MSPGRKVPPTLMAKSLRARRIRYDQTGSLARVALPCLIFNNLAMAFISPVWQIWATSQAWLGEFGLGVSMYFTTLMLVGILLLVLGCVNR